MVPVRDLLAIRARLHALRLIQTYVEVLDAAGTSDRVRHVATESTNRRSHEAQARLRRLNSSIATPHRCELGKLWIKSGF